MYMAIKPVFQFSVQLGRGEGIEFRKLSDSITEYLK
jgi:hypothetical protein